ncbi:MAG: hypothetical protein Q9188_002197 [Gyalolechia gomerana]
MPAIYTKPIYRRFDTSLAELIVFILITVVILAIVIILIMGPRAGLSLLYSQFFVKLPLPTRSFAGETIIITGSNSGLGRSAAKQILRLGAAKVILAVRNLSRGEAARRQILKASGRSSPSELVDVWELDLSNHESVVAFAKRTEGLDRLDAVIQNAGISTHEFVLADGDESSLTVNVISTYLLTLLLLPKLRASALRYGITPRVSVVTSSVHNFTNLSAKSARMIFSEMNDPKSRVSKMATRYFDTKLLQVLYTRALAEALTRHASTDTVSLACADRSVNGHQDREMKADVVLNMLNPGFCDSELFKQPSSAFKLQMQIMGRTAEEGSRALVDAIARGKESHGTYLNDCKVARVSEWVGSEEGKKTQERVWKELNEKLEKIVPGVVGNI